MSQRTWTWKAYYRAVRANTLNYEALWRLRWVIFRAWVANRGIQYPELDHVDTQSAVVCDAFREKVYGHSNVMESEVDKLNEAVKDIQLIMRLEEFEELCKEKVQVGKDQEKAQSEKDSHSKNRGGKKPN